MENAPLVSVVMATYNMGQYVEQAVRSVLEQDYPAVEVIVVDDGSTDHTPAVLSQFAGDARVRAMRQENAGQTVAKNRGWRAAQGKYIGFCDADNLWLPGKLALQVPLLEARGGFAVSYGDIQLVDGNNNDLPNPKVKRYSGKITGLLLVDNFVTFNTTLVPGHLLEEAGGFDESLRMGIDYDLWLRLSVKYPFQYLAQPLVRYRIWGGQMSNRLAERFENCFRLLERFLEQNPGSVSPAEAARGWAHTYVSRGRWRASQGDYRLALSDYAKAFQYRPGDLRLWKSVARLILGR
jgi:glycosyltransferase involved in cell wall biosynthesis